MPLSESKLGFRTQNLCKDHLFHTDRHYNLCLTISDIYLFIHSFSIGHGQSSYCTAKLSFFSDKWPYWGWELGTGIAARGWILWTMIFYNLKKFTSRSVYVIRGQTLFWVHQKLVIELLKYDHFLTKCRFWPLTTISK